tara:strand:+ start:2017 stop:2373 length:357 start_codon:yes stop_codon:yes gene_type:complete
MGSKFASSKQALAICDRCGQTFKLKKLKVEKVRGRETNVKVCRSCYDPDHPQNKLGDVLVKDPQAIRNPRPDTSLGDSGRSSSRLIQYGYNPVGGGDNILMLNTLVGNGKVGTVTVTT